ncbi:MAG: PIG-L deacetylase family protein [Spirochaetaceae bacterium]
MVETVLSYSGLLILPVIVLAAFAVTSFLLRFLRLAKYPGFRRRFDPELRFLTRGPKLIGLGVILVCVLVPTILGVLLPPKPTRRAAVADSHESVLPWESMVDGDTRTAARPTDAPGDLPPADATSTEAPPGLPAEISESIRDLVPLSLEEHGYRNTVQVPPGAFEEGALPESLSSVEVLFIHAHPDDESLDFAVLMARLARRGLSIGTLLLTDGESGVDRYPYRAGVPGYEDHPLSGRALRDTRVREAEQALRVLGSDYYIRMGLPNHPYNGIADERGLEEILEAWGGEELLVERLVALIRAAGPRFIVSPDLASDAREHFEHEATGYLVRRAVEELRFQGEGPDGYLVSVDPFQREHYPVTFGVPKRGQAEDLGKVQRAALSQHHTQADASVIGRRRLVGLPAEYYLPVFWGLEESLGSILGLDEELLARESPLLQVALAYQEDVGHRPSPAIE